MSYSSTVKSLVVLSFLSGFSLTTAQAQDVPPPPKRATPAELVKCEEEYMSREPKADLGRSQYHDKIRDLCNKSVHGAQKSENGSEPATNDYYFSGNNNGFVYELDEECQQVRIDDELIFICPEGKYKPTIRNNRTGFMPVIEPVSPLKPSEQQ